VAVLLLTTVKAPLPAVSSVGPTWRLVRPVRPLPVIVTVFRPVVGALAGLMPVILGGGVGGVS
jgi:hypothetical protein